MLLLVDGDVVVAGAANVAADAAACRALAAEVSGLGEVTDTDVRAGVHELADVCADLLEVVAIDLDLVAARMGAGAQLYSAVESAVAVAIRSHRR